MNPNPVPSVMSVVSVVFHPPYSHPPHCHNGGIQTKARAWREKNKAGWKTTDTTDATDAEKIAAQPKAKGWSLCSQATPAGLPVWDARFLNGRGNGQDG